MKLNESIAKQVQIWTESERMMNWSHSILYFDGEHVSVQTHLQRLRCHVHLPDSHARRL